jgi:hypothetical protein
MEITKRSWRWLGYPSFHMMSQPLNLILRESFKKGLDLPTLHRTTFHNEPFLRDDVIPFSIGDYLKPEVDVEQYCRLSVLLYRDGSGVRNNDSTGLGNGALGCTILGRETERE